MKLVRLFRGRRDRLETASALALSLGLAVSLGIAQAAAQSSGPAQQPPPVHLDIKPFSPPQQSAAPAPPEPAWQGRDIDGDGAPDFANPTGETPRGHDAFGDGYFHARRDGGARAHEGVDYDSRPGQPVVAPISGYVGKIGYAYPGDERFRYVEIDNPALHLQARVFYVNPKVGVGDSVELGRPIGTARSLQARYRGITDHVHLEIDRDGRKMDAQTLILARAPTTTLMAALN